MRKKNSEDDFQKGKQMSRELFQELRALLMERLDLARELSDEEILEEIDDLILGRMREYCLSLKEKVQLRQELFHSVRKLDVLQELIEDETVTEIMVNGPDAIFVERAGKLTKWDKTFTSGEKLEDVIQQIVGKCNRVVNESMPIVDARLDNGARVNAVIRPVALNGPILTIRRFPDTPITMEKLIALGSLPSECAEFLAALVRARYSMVIGGGTGSGKTTFLGALSNYIPPDERLITIEDNAELKIQGIANLVRLEAKMANMEGAASITIRDLIKTALRMRPDRIIVGEVRGGEAVDMLQALNTGHDGSLSTAHANSASDMLSRLETMTLMGVDLPLEAIRRQIASGVDILIHLGRMRDKSRKVLEITEICGFENHEIKTRTLYRWQEGKGLVQTAELLNREKLVRAGVTI
nr:ATPase, T2SS/T4P/T4SS family [Blautia sp. Marseille-P3087]